MKLTLDHNIVSSFMLWLDHTLLEKGQAYINTTGEFFFDKDQQFANHTSFTSPFRQFVYDRSVNGPIIPSGVYYQGQFLGAQSGAKIDFQNGRVLFTGTAKNLKPLTGAFSYKEFYTYYTTDSEERLLFETKFIPRAKNYQPETGLASNEKIIPAVFVKYDQGTNTPLAFGGMDTTEINIRCIVLVDNPYLLDGACSVLRDTARTSFSLLTPEYHPFDALGDLKSGYYDYNYVNTANFNAQTQLFIKNVYYSKFSEKVNLDTNLKAYGAFMDFEIEMLRYPRA